MLVFTVAALTIFHPGHYFPQMSNQRQAKETSAESAAESGLEGSEK